MRTLFILALTLTAGFSTQTWAHDIELSEPKSPADLTNPQALTERLTDDAAQLNWPSTVLKKEIGAQRDGGRMCAFAIFQLNNISRRDTALLVIKSAGVFASALSDSALMHQACVTLKCPGRTARIFLPMDELRKLAQNLDDAQFTLEQKKSLVKACDWHDLDAACDECERLMMPVQTIPTPAPRPNVLPRLMLKNNQFVDAAAMDELNDCYLLQDDTGRFLRLKKKDVLKIVPPEPKTAMTY